MRKKAQDNAGTALRELLAERGITISDASRKLFDSFSLDNGTKISVDNELVTAINYHETGRWEQLDILPDGTCVLNICLYGGF